MLCCLQNVAKGCVIKSGTLATLDHIIWIADFSLVRAENEKKCQRLHESYIKPPRFTKPKTSLFKLPVLASVDGVALVVLRAGVVAHVRHGPRQHARGTQRTVVPAQFGTLVIESPVNFESVIITGRYCTMSGLSIAAFPGAHSDLPCKLYSKI